MRARFIRFHLPPRFLLLAGAAGTVCICGTARAAETVKQVPGPAGHTVWEIDQPVVNKPASDYPQIVFAPGQTVTVTGTGCVQTGGSGHTWKRYVDPAGSNSATLYHGKISIPGVTSGLVDFNPRQPTVYIIPANASVPAGQMHLQLGYSDDGYGDNGYSNRNSDNGNMDQCRGLGDASIRIDIGPPWPAVQPPAMADYTFTINNVMIRNPRTHHGGQDGTDTDVLGTAVVVNGTQSAVGGETIGNVKYGAHPVNFPTVIQQVAPNDRLSFVYTVVNADNPEAQATTTLVAGIVSKVATLVPGAGSALSAVASGAGDLINVLNPDCDGPVVADAFPASGTDLARWTANGPYIRTISFPGVNSADGCGSNSFYEVTYTISRSAPQIQPFILYINARNLATKLGPKTRAFRR